MLVHIRDRVDDPIPRSIVLGARDEEVVTEAFDKDIDML